MFLFSIFLILWRSNIYKQNKLRLLILVVYCSVLIKISLIIHSYADTYSLILVSYIEVKNSILCFLFTVLHQVDVSARFLSSVKDRPTDEKRRFLESKGLSDDEIKAAFSLSRHRDSTSGKDEISYDNAIKRYYSVTIATEGLL